MKSLFTSLFFLTITPVFADQSIAPLPLKSSDIAVTRTIDSRSMVPGINQERALVEFTQKLDKNALTIARQSAILQSSRQYWLDVSATELNAGLRFNTTASGTIVRISPFSPQSQRFELSTADIIVGPVSRQTRAGDNVAALADQQSLNASGAQFSSGTVAFRIHEDAGFGSMRLQVPALPDGQYIVHVFEPQSQAVLTLQTNANSYLPDSTLQATLKLNGIKHNLQSNDIQAFITSPDATRSYPVNLAVSREGVSIRAGLPSVTEFNAGLWTVNASISTTTAGVVVQRDIKTAFDLAIPTARIINAQLMPAALLQDESKQDDSLSLAVQLETAVAGRYEISGTLYGHNSNGQLLPIAMTQAANWLDNGMQSLPLRFASDVVSGSGLTGPFEIRNLQLKDQSRMGLLHKQARAWQITR